jgi:ATP-independent RNA helicase DbpA
MTSENEQAETPTTPRVPSAFRALALSEKLLTVIEEIGFTEMTKVQSETIPLLLEGKDVVVQAPTGTGKTAAFALPILHSISMEARIPGALILCPTRELSAQVAREIRRLGRAHAGLRVLVLSGGEPRQRQKASLEEGAHILIGTPGRVLDHLRRQDLDLSSVKVLVLDEADRMLDMGFEEDMESILKAAPKPRLTAFFSATYPRSIESMSRKHQDKALRVTIEAPAKEAHEIRQFVMMVEPELKLSTLRWVLEHHAHESALVFTNFKASAADVESILTKVGISAASLHGDLEQVDRDRVMAKFRNGSVRVLVATDVAARGIDIEGLDLVVNYEMANKPETHVHRVGRTGRAGKTGVAITFATSREREKIEAIEGFIGVTLERTKRARNEDGTPERASIEETRDAKMDTLRIAGGRRDKVRPGDILGALTGEAGGLAGTDIGKIEIHDNFAYVAVARHVSELALKSLMNGRIKGRRFRVERA